MNRNRYITIISLILSLLAMLLLIGCFGTGSTNTLNRKYEIVKVSQVESQEAKWEIYQLRIELEGGANFTVDLNLGDGDKVDCWYKAEKPSTGANVGFQVKAGDSVLYTSTATQDSASDRLTFNAKKANGTSYRLIFHNNLTDKKSKETIFTEIIYPLNDSGEDSIFIPLGAK